MRDEEISKRLQQQMDTVHVLPDLRRRTLMKIEGKEEPEMKKKIAFTPVLAFAILMVSICTALAAGFFWNHPLETELDINDSNREQYQAANLLAMPDLTQTHNGITVSVDQCAVDEHTAYISFRINGWTLADGDEPGFDIAKCDLGLEEGSSITGGFSSVWSDEKKAEMFADDEGTLVYCFYACAMEESMIGRSVHVELGNPGIYRKDKSLTIDVMQEDTWTFDWTLTGTQESIYWGNIDLPIGDTQWVMNSFNLSPVTAIITSTPPAGIQFGENVNDAEKLPTFVGVVMDDGTEYRLTGMGGSEMKDNAYREVVSLARIVGGLENVRAVLFTVPGSNATMSIELPEINSHTEK